MVERALSLEYPPEHLLFMDKTPEAMIKTGDALLRLGKSVITFRGRPVLDIGCGYGRMAYALERDGFSRLYQGIDLLKQPITWLQQNFTPVRPTFQFDHADIANDRYNSSGALSATDFHFPDIETPDAVFLLSVFTHMYEIEIEHYLDELARMIDSTSVVYSTFFLINDTMRDREKAGLCHFPMKHEINDHCWYFNPSDPLHAIGYDETWLRKQLLNRGLYIQAIYYGGWTGSGTALSGQDTIFISKMG
ncbi:class I SAM-dependent methyltransferase [Agrobacterium rhizogenes]|nr:class I SAM-dependent methyltransferase [Rhizobium rhizogenes]